MRAAGVGLLVMSVLSLAGCVHVPASGAADSTPATADAGALPPDHVETPRYRIDIDYPDLPASEAALATVLHETGNRAKRAFLQGLPDPEALPEYADRQLQLKLDFEVVARTARFVSVRERGMQATGGAHPIPVDASFVYDAQAGRVIAPDDLFGDPDKARQRLAQAARARLKPKLLSRMPKDPDTSAEARRQWRANMLEMIEAGTEPTPSNFANFVVPAGPGGKAAGLRLIFSPYQVSPYVYGTQMVDVPVSVFADLLKVDYRGAFVAE